MNRKLHRPSVDVFPSSTTFDTARAAATLCSFLAFFLSDAHARQVQAEEPSHKSARDHDRVSSAVGPNSNESDGVIDERRDLSIETSYTSSGWARSTSDGSVSSPKPGPPPILPFLLSNCSRFFRTSSRSCSYFKLFLPAKARIGKVSRSTVVKGPVDPSEVLRSRRSSRGFFASDRSPISTSRSILEMTTVKREVSERATIVGVRESERRTESIML